MNFLAHLYLADPAVSPHPAGIASPLALAGNLMPDLVRGRLPSDLPAQVTAGIFRHRRVDHWTDTHPAFAATRDRLKPTQGRFAGIVADVVYDQVLAHHWPDFHTTPLPDFIAETYARLTQPQAQDIMPPRMRGAITLMVAQDWLGRYRTDEGLRATFHQMSQRFSQRFGREINLETAVDNFAIHRADITDDFHHLFPDLVRRCRALDEKNESNPTNKPNP